MIKKVLGALALIGIVMYVYNDPTGAADLVKNVVNVVGGFFAELSKH